MLLIAICKFLAPVDMITSANKLIELECQTNFGRSAGDMVM